MADIRIKVAKDKAKLVKALRAGEGSTGPFQTYYEVLAFAAALGLENKKFHPFDESKVSGEIDPIRQEQFASKGYDQLINLVAAVHTRSPKILGESEKAELEKIEIFEAYSNGGLDYLREKLMGSNDYFQQISLILTSQRPSSIQAGEDILDWDIIKTL